MNTFEDSWSWRPPSSLPSNTTTTLPPKSNKGALVTKLRFAHGTSHVVTAFIFLKVLWTYLARALLQFTFCYKCFKLIISFCFFFFDWKAKMTKFTGLLAFQALVKATDWALYLVLIQNGLTLAPLSDAVLDNLTSFFCKLFINLQTCYLYNHVWDESPNILIWNEQICSFLFNALHTFEFVLSVFNISSDLLFRTGSVSYVIASWELYLVFCI